MRARKLERAVALQELSELRKKNVGDYFMNFSRHLRPWLHELAQKYKERGEFPLMSMVLLPSYYKEGRDKEIAVFAGLLLNDGVNMVGQIAELRSMLGECPWEWFLKRDFVSLSIGSRMNYRTAGLLNWKIARLFDRLWQEHFNNTTKTADNIGQTIKMITDIQHCSYFEVLTYLLENCSVGNYFYKLRLLLQVLACSDGFSFGLWSIDPMELKCPLTTEIRRFVEAWFPDYRKFGSVDDAIRLFGFERDCDFFYACLGYKELQKRNPKGCRLLATRYQSWYDLGTKRKAYRWREILPMIEF